jgi:hypothetical protein
MVEMKYFISEITLDWSLNRHRVKGDGGKYRGGVRGKKIGLYDRNSDRYVWFAVIKKHPDKLGYIVERKQILLPSVLLIGNRICFSKVSFHCIGEKL